MNHSRRRICALVLPVIAVTFLLLGAGGQKGPYPFPGNHPGAVADRAPSAAQIRALDSLRTFSGPDLVVRWDRETGAPRTLQGDLARPFVGSAEEGARHFLAERAALIVPDVLPVEAFDDPSASPLRTSRVVDRGRVEHVSFLQYHGDLPVVRGGYTVSLRRDGRTLTVVSAMGTFFPGIGKDFVVDPAIGADEAIGVAREAMAPGLDLLGPASKRLVIYPLEGAYHLAWEVEIDVREPRGQFQVFVDALDGSILEAQDRIMTGIVVGETYERNWVRTPSTSLLGLRDAFVSRNGRVVLTDENGEYDDGGATTVDTALRGPYCIALNDDTNEVFYSGPPDVLWSYPTSDTHFEEVLVFYHTNIFHAYVRHTLGFQGADVQLPAVVHIGNNYNNAYYDGSGIWFGDGDGTNWTSFCQDDIIYHEYGHFMFDMAINMGYGNNEVGGMNEGGADYFAGTFTDDSVLGEAARLSGSGRIRDMDNKGWNPPRIYPDFLVDNNFEPHRGGEVWGGTLWDIRKDIGPTFTDKAAWEGLFYLPPWPLFIDGRHGVVQADIDHHYGINKYTIELRMWERGIGPPPDTDPLVRFRADPSYGIAPLPVVFTALVSDDGTVASYDWDFGDGATLSTADPVVTHLYPDEGIYTVTLVATDDTGASGSWSADVEAIPPGELVISPDEGDVGFVRSDQPAGNFFGDDDIYAGYLSDYDYHGAALFRLPFLPGSTSNLVFESVTLELMGQDGSAKAPDGGIWSLKMLGGDIDATWRDEGYTSLVNAPAAFTLDSDLGSADLSPGVSNIFSVTSDQMPTLHGRLAGGTVSFRVDGPYGVANLFSWDSGYDRFREDPTATRTKPVLRLKYREVRSMGDVNGDGRVNRTDARILGEVLVGERTISTEDEALADVDRNGNLDCRDVAGIVAKAAGKIDF